MRNGLVFRRQMWALATEGIGGGALPIGPDGTPGLPTPSACVANDGERVTSWMDRRERVKLTAKNGNGMGMPLTIAVQLLPTPVAQTGKGGPKGLDGGSGARQMLADAGFPRAAGAPTQLPTPRTCSAMAARLNTTGNLEGERFPNLETVIAREMLPTPSAGEAKQSGNVENWQRRQLKHAATGQDLQMPLAVAVKLLPTPTTNDSKNASLPPSQAERDGLAGAMLRDDSIPTGAATYLNPSFVEEMMGFPVGWTA